MPEIKEITCHKEVTPLGDWTIAAKVVLNDGSEGTQSVLVKASKGHKEAVYIEVEKAVDVFPSAINDALMGEEAYNQRRIDRDPSRYGWHRK